MKKNSIQFDSFQLKIIAIIAMLINHIGIGFPFFYQNEPLYFITQIIGRLTMPIMIYLLVEGFHHTRNVYKYAFRLFIFWIISIVPFSLYFYNTPFGWPGNMMFTLLICLLMLIAYEHTNHIFLHIAIVVIATLATYKSDWAFAAVLMTFGFYRIKDPKLRIIVPVVYTSFLSVFIDMFYYQSAQVWRPWSFLAMLLVLPLLLNYNGKRGLSIPWAKWGFYVFYPAHLLLLYFIRNMLLY